MEEFKNKSAYITNIPNIVSEDYGFSQEKRDFKGIKKIGIFGGTFDPIHNGHLIAADVARKKLGLELVIFIPTGHTSYKRGKVSDSIYRYEMICLAIASNKYFFVSSLEINKNEIAYTVDTIEEIKEYCDNDVEIYFIMGTDVLEGVIKWKGVNQLIKMCNIVAITRPNYNKENSKSVVKLINMGAKIYYIEDLALDISSSNIRKNIKERRSVKYLIPKKVEEFIKTKGLYIDEN